jgi:1-acyl-sn-glycerol-3-phosphate acyltransferase
MQALRQARSALGLLLVIAFFVFPGTPVMYLIVYPLIALRPKRKRWATSWFMKMMCFGITGGFRIGGARFRLDGRIPTGDGGALIVGNHQSQLDIVLASMMGDPVVPTFVPRAIYARGIPLVSACIRLLECPIVNPKRDAPGAVAEMRKAARREAYGLLIYPEGHRSTDGTLKPFRSAGLRAVLEERKMPVYLVVSDGYGEARRFKDFVFNVHRMRCQAEVIGPLPPPERPEDFDAAIDGWRELMIQRLGEMRARREAAGG